jgi:predicted deacylase
MKDLHCGFGVTILMDSRKSQLWSATDDEQIRLMVARGASAFRASVALKRSRPSLLQRARKLGCPFSSLREARKKAGLGSGAALTASVFD